MPKYMILQSVVTGIVLILVTLMFFVVFFKTQVEPQQNEPITTQHV